MSPSSPEEQKQIEALEATVNFDTSPVEDLITLGLLYIEPAHEAEQGIHCFELALRRDPGCALAAVWQAYNLQHYMMDPESLRRALTILEPFCPEGQQERGAALMLSALILRDLEGHSDKLLPLLAESVRAEPDWVSNRELLAELCRKQARYHEALDQARRALSNIIPVDHAWGVMRENYESFITWRTAYRHSEDLERFIDKIQNEWQEANA